MTGNTIKKIKAIAVDIDGTLTDDKRRISTVAIDALRSAENHGIRVIICSGNALPVAYGIATMIGVSGPVVAENGGIVLYDHSIYKLRDIEDAMAAYREIKEKFKIVPILSNRWRETEIGFRTDADLYDIMKVVEKYGLVAEDTGWAIHIFKKGFGKLAGVKKAAELLKISLKDIMAIGDGQNDVEFVSRCGIGIAVKNSSEELKRIADYVCSQANGMGVKEAIDRFILHKDM